MYVYNYTRTDGQSCPPLPHAWSGQTHSHAVSNSQCSLHLKGFIIWVNLIATTASSMCNILCTYLEATITHLPHVICMNYAITI